MRYGVVPSGGLGTRSLLPHSKELAQVAARPVIEYIFDRLVLAGIEHIFVTTHIDKLDLIAYLKNYSPRKSLLTILSGERKGLLDGIVSPGQTLHDDDELYFGLPDTIWYPEDGFARLSEVQSNLALGVIKSLAPQLYGSVVVSHDLAESIVEKPSDPVSPWIWAFGKFKVSVIPQLLHLSQQRPAFTDVLGSYAAISPVPVVTFPDGIYFDTGTPSGLNLANDYVKK